MKQKDIEALTLTELKERVRDEKTSLTKMRMGHKTAAIENPMTLRTARKLVARLSTELTKKNKATQPSEANT
ncbi:MAG: 50S ribosomal protein L29 [Bacteroidia bacterium]